MDNVQSFLKEMGNRISKQRKLLGLTQEQVAEMADISPQLLSNAENGTRAIGSDKLYRISKALSVSADYLLTGRMVEPDVNELSQKIIKAPPEIQDKIERIVEILLED